MDWIIQWLLALIMALGAFSIPPPAPPPTTPPTPSITGQATWYRYYQGQAAAGSELRAFLGPNWRGMTVQVCATHGCVIVKLTDWCGCPGSRIIDLDRRDFDTLSDPSRGVIDVTVGSFFMLSQK